MGDQMRETLNSRPLDGYQPEVGAALWRLENTRFRTLRFLDEEKAAEYLDVDTGGNMIGTILYHLALIETDWLFVEILEEPFPDEVKRLLPADDRDQQGVLTAIRGQSLEEHLDRLKVVRAILLDRIRPMTAEDLHRVRSLPSYDVTPAWVLHHLSQHEAEHRGEMGAALARLKA